MKSGAAEPSDLSPSSGPPYVEGRSDSQKAKTEQRQVKKVTKVCGRVGGASARKLRHMKKTGPCKDWYLAALAQCPVNSRHIIDVSSKETSCLGFH